MPSASKSIVFGEVVTLKSAPAFEEHCLPADGATAQTTRRRLEATATSKIEPLSIESLVGERVKETG